MREKIIGLKIRVDGNDRSVRTVKSLETQLSKVGVQLAAVNKQLAEMARLSEQVGKATKDARQARQAGGSTSRTRSANERNADFVGPRSTPDTAASLRRDIRAAQEAGLAYDDLIQRAGFLKDEQAKANKEIRQAAREFEKTRSAAGSYRAINAELVDLRNTYRELSRAERDGIAGDKALRRIQKLDRELKDLDASMGIYARNVGNYGSAFNRLGGVALRTLGVLGIALSADQIVADAARISDGIANVEKVAGLTTEQVRALSAALSDRDTRTSLEDLLNIAEIGGRLGINAEVLGVDEAQAQILAFTDAIDTANVALGDQFNNDAGQVASTLAGLRNVLTNFRPNGDADIGGDLLRIGNALNFLETQGNSTAPVIADFVNRIGGIAVPLGASTESIFALSTRLDELEVTAERGGTAVGNTLAKLAAAPEQFADQVVSAGLIDSVDSFTTLVNDDIVSALVLVSSAVQQNSADNTEFAQNLAGLGITGARAQEVFAKLGGDFERYNELLRISGEQLGQTDSLTEEFSKKNNTLAGDLEKVRNQITEAFASGEVQDALRFVIQRISDLIGILTALPKTIADNRASIGLLVLAMLSFNAANIAAAVSSISLRRSLVAARIATRALNVAIRANPIGFFIGLLLTLGGILVGLYNNSETFRNGVNRLADGFRNAFEQSSFLRTALGPLGFVVKFLLDLFREGPVVFEDYYDAIATMVQNAVPAIQNLAAEFVKFNLKVVDALSFGLSETLEQQIDAIDAEIAARERQIEANIEARDRRAVERRKKRLAQAKLDAQAEEAGVTVDRSLSAEEQAELIRAAAARKAAAEDRVRQKVLEGKDLTQAERDIFGTLEQDEQRSLQKRAQARKTAAEERRRAAEKAARDRLAAARNIVDLENRLIAKDSERRQAELRTTAERDIAALVGDPEQVERQAELIRAVLAKELESIDEQRAEAHREALALISEYEKELTAARVNAVASQEQAAFDRSKASFDLQQQALDTQLAIQQNGLVKQYRAGEITFREFTERKEALERKGVADSQALAERRFVEETALDARLTEQLILQAEHRREIRRREREGEQSERDARLRSEFEAGNLSEDELNEGLESSEQLRREQDLADETAYQEQLFELQTDFAERGLKRQEKTAEREQEIRENNRKAIERIERKKREAILDGAEALGNAIGDFFTGQISTFKDFQKQILLIALEALEKFALLSIAQATMREVGSKGFIGLGTAAILTGIIKAASSGLRSVVENFEEGGRLNGQGGRWTGGFVPAGSGPIVGNRHSGSGIRGTYNGRAVEFEGGEYKLQNGPDAYIINRRSTQVFGPLLRQLSANPHRYSAQRRAAASSINAYRGFGRAFYNDGGVLPSRGTALAAPLTPAGEVPFGTSSGDPEARRLAEVGVQAALAATDAAMAANRRIDRIAVTLNPGEAIRRGQEQIEVEGRRSL